MKDILSVLIWKFFESVIELLAEQKKGIKGWHIETERATDGKIESVCVKRKK